MSKQVADARICCRQIVIVFEPVAEHRLGVTQIDPAVAVVGDIFGPSRQHASYVARSVKEDIVDEYLSLGSAAHRAGNTHADRDLLNVRRINRRELAQGDVPLLVNVTENRIYLPILMCEHKPAPAPQLGTASIGGVVQGFVGDTLELMPGAKVATYRPGGEVYQTSSIYNGTYHFYNIPPGTYFVYAQTWVNDALLTDSATVTVVADERNYEVNLMLQ